MPPRPHVVLITLDSWRHDALGRVTDKRALARYGLADKLHTPNLDGFAAECVHFTQALSPAPGTTSAHSSLMTGLYPTAHGVRAFMEQRLDPSVRTLAEHLRGIGYATVTSHEVEEEEELGVGLLFDNGVDALRGFDEIVRTDEELAASRAVRSGRPVLAFLHLWDLHEPYLHGACESIPDRHAPLLEKLADLEDRYGVPLTAVPELTARHLTPAIRRLERAIEDTATHNREFFRWYVDGLNHFDRRRWPRLLETLHRAGLWDDAIVVVFGDHGEGPIEDPVGAVRRFGHGAPLLDDRLRVPLLIRGLPGVTPGQVGAQVSLVDVAPTVMDALGLSPSHPNPDAPDAQRGVSLLGLAAGRTSPSRVVFAEAFTDAPGTGLPLLTQRVARDGHLKLWSVDGEPILSRFLPAELAAERLVRRALGRVRQGWRSRAVDERRLSSRRLFWFDLDDDPFEERPRRWRSADPPEVQTLRGALVRLYDQPVYGPPLRTGDPGRSAELRKRLAALGYVE